MFQLTADEIFEYLDDGSTIHSCISVQSSLVRGFSENLFEDTFMIYIVSQF